VVDFCVWQRSPQASPNASPWPVFRTCRREIAFAEPAAMPPADAETLSGEAAYAHLLQVICGLESPMLGETEVMHQFRTFVDTLPGEHHALQSLGRRLLADARAVRAQHLSGLGSRSYGSAVRRHVRGCERVAVIGTGMLCREVLPFVADDRRLVDVYGRRSAFDASLASVCYRRLDCRDAESPLEGQAALVIAAPVDAAVIAQVARRYASLTCVIDLRGEADAEPVPPLAPIVSLADVFNEMQRAAQVADRRVIAAKADIARCARAFATRAVLNPSGWHDLCA
jgi:glutamyl-tRNA reductase